MSICCQCRDEIRAWENTRPSTHVRTGTRFASNAARDDTAAGLRDRYDARWREWRDLVVFQIGLIHRVCAERHVDQPALFELREAS